MSFKAQHTKFISTGDKALSSKISDLTHACDSLDKLQISIYSLDKEKFIYYNGALENTVGKHCDKLHDEGWNYLFSLINPDELVSVRNKIHGFLCKPYFKEPFILKYHIENENGKKIFLRHEMLLHQLEDQMLAINYFFDISEKELIEGYFQESENNKLNFSKNKATLISPREKEVLRLVADGFSSKQIADRLFISNHTAISHRKNLIEKFNVKNTAQLIKRAVSSIELW